MLAILTTHPIQYQVPLWQALAQDGRLPFEVWYLTNHGVRPSRDREFGQTFSWDIDSLTGYPHRFLPAVEGTTPATFLKCRLGKVYAPGFEPAERWHFGFKGGRWRPTGRRGNFRYLGDVPKIELMQYYNRSSVLVLPSIADAYPLVVLEALVCGLPVIVSANTGSKEMVRDGEDGFVVPIRDVGALKQKILLLYEDPDAQYRMAEAAAQRASQLTLEGYARKVLQMYERLVGTTPEDVGVA